MPASCRGAMRTTLRGNPRPIPPLPGGHRVPWLCGRWLEGNFQGPIGYPPKAAAADWMPAHRTVAGRHPGATNPKVAMQRPRCREITERNRAGHTFLLQAWETCARNPSPNRSSKRKLGPQEAKGSPSIHPNPSFPRRRESISLCGRGRSRTVRGIWIPACAGMTKGRSTSHPSCRTCSDIHREDAAKPPGGSRPAPG